MNSNKAQHKRESQLQQLVNLKRSKQKKQKTLDSSSSSDEDNSKNNNDYTSTKNQNKKRLKKFANKNNIFSDSNIEINNNFEKQNSLQNSQQSIQQSQQNQSSQQESIAPQSTSSEQYSNSKCGTQEFLVNDSQISYMDDSESIKSPQNNQKEEKEKFQTPKSKKQLQKEEVEQYFQSLKISQSKRKQNKINILNYRTQELFDKCVQDRTLRKRLEGELGYCLFQKTLRYVKEREGEEEDLRDLMSKLIVEEMPDDYERGQEKAGPYHFCRENAHRISGHQVMEKNQILSEKKTKKENHEENYSQSSSEALEDQRVSRQQNFGQFLKNNNINQENQSSTNNDNSESQSQQSSQTQENLF